MNTFNRIVAIVLWAVLMAAVGVAAVAPLATIAFLQDALTQGVAWVRAQQEADASNFLIGQIAVGVIALIIFGVLIGFGDLEWSTPRRAHSHRAGRPSRARYLEH